jgi:hypothetical protein
MFLKGATQVRRAGFFVCAPASVRRAVLRENSSRGSTAYSGLSKMSLASNLLKNVPNFRSRRKAQSSICIQEGEPSKNKHLSRIGERRKIR